MPSGRRCVERDRHGEAGQHAEDHGPDQGGESSAEVLEGRQPRPTAARVIIHQTTAASAALANPKQVAASGGGRRKLAAR